MCWTNPRRTAPPEGVHDAASVTMSSSCWRGWGRVGRGCPLPAHGSPQPVQRRHRLCRARMRGAFPGGGAHQPSSGTPESVSSDLRRDLGIWGAVLGLVHIGIGLTVHLRGRMHLGFPPPPEAGARFPLRTDAFGGANHLGVIAGLVLAVLLALSSDRALRRLGPKTWKRWQRLSYVGAIATLGHGVLYSFSSTVARASRSPSPWW